jgi:excinuclease ABC subunit C
MPAMDGLFPLDQFREFGPSNWALAPLPPIQRAEGRGPGTLRVQVRLRCPAKPGVYGMLDAAGELIYVGKAKELRKRLLSYFRAGSRPAKAARVIRHARAIVWEICSHEFAALLREQELIRRWRPRSNVQGQPLRRRLGFLCVGRAPGPYAYLSRRPATETLAAFGPISWTERTHRAVQRVNDCFRLRDCPQPQEILFPEQGGLYALGKAPGCLRAELGTCLAPCTGLCPRDDYSAQVQAAVAFLTGASPKPIEELAKRMHAAAAAQQFELAASLRDQGNDLAWLAEQLARIRQAQKAMSFIYPLLGWDGSVHWYFVHGARVVAAAPEPGHGESARHTARLITSVYGGKRPEDLLASYEHHDSRMLVMQWFRQRRRERRKTLTPEEALEKCDALARIRA